MIDGLTDRQLDDLGNAEIIEALKDADIEDPNLVSWEIEDQEVEE